MAERRVTTYEVEYEVVNEDALLTAVFRDSRPEVDPSQHLGLAVNELMRPALTAAPGVRLLRERTTGRVQNREN